MGSTRSSLLGKGLLLMDIQCIAASFDGLLAVSMTEWFTGLLGVLWRIFQIALGLGFVIFVHELGHFLAAKFFGVKCEKFYVGFDVPIKIAGIQLPRTLGKFQWGETEYGIGLIPLGGYVKMLGQDDDPRQAEAEAERIRLADPNSPNQASRLDPRSYPAKPVYARMIIISAGIIMNILFAILLGAAAFFYGVPYTPTIIGDVHPGDPAWQAGLQPGDQVLQIGAMKKPNENFYFSDMLEEVLVWGISDKTKPIPIHFRRDGKEQTIEVLPTQRHDRNGMRSMLGIGPMRSSTITPMVSLEAPPESTEYLGLRGGDRVVAVDGKPLPVDPTFNLARSEELVKHLLSKNDSPVLLTVERKSTDQNSQRVDVELPPVPRNTLGLLFAKAKIAAIQPGSDAEKAGLLPNANLLSFNGSPVEDASNLHLEVLQQVGKEVFIEFASDDATPPTKFRWMVPELPRLSGSELPSPVGIELPGSGIVLQVDRQITGTIPDSPAAKAGFQAGDQLQQIVIQAQGPARQELLQKFNKQLFEPHMLDDFFNVLDVQENLLQHLPVGTDVKVFVLRDQKVVDAVCQVQASTRWNRPWRGIEFEGLSSTHQTSDAITALKLGSFETWRRMKMVGNFLSLLVSGKVSAKYLGGPGMIFYQASSAAAEGPSKLLLFLVMLSANLAILNALPIPALDGGHFAFLTLEWIMGKPINEELQARITMLGVLCLLLLMAFVIFNDARFFITR